jgi:uncharacterized protein (DUF1499 family)
MRALTPVAASRAERRSALAALLLAGLLATCAGAPPAELGLHAGRLADCPARPNCVASEASDPDRRIDPLRFEGEPARAWAALRAVLAAWPRTQIVRADAGHLHAEARSWLLGFVDDLEFQLDPAAGLIGLRSAARTGYWDLGVNRRRAEALRAALRQALAAPAA